MKNVAGYDVSRLVAGSLGILGVLLEVSLKLLPVPAGTLTVRRDVDAAVASELLAHATQRGLPVSASFWCDGELHLRLDGSAAGLAAIAPEFGGAPVAPAVAAAFWHQVREQQHPFFAGSGPLWRLTVPVTATAAVMRQHSAAAFEWNGGQVWITGAARPALEALARAHGGDTTLFRQSGEPWNAATEVFAPLSPGLLELHRAVKRVFDPAGILNPGRMYAGL
jgi:glycolate oxidase FAD binding subunit